MIRASMIFQVVVMEIEIKVEHQMTCWKAEVIAMHQLIQLLQLQLLVIS